MTVAERLPRKLSSSEEDLLVILDQLAYADSEAGGEGWSTLDVLASEFFAGEMWTAQVLRVLIVRGLAEKRHKPGDRRFSQFALTEAGAALVDLISTPQTGEADRA